MHFGNVDNPPGATKMKMLVSDVLTPETKNDACDICRQGSGRKFTSDLMRMNRYFYILGEEKKAF